MASRRPKVRRLRQWSWAGTIEHGSERCEAPLKPEATKFRNPAKYDSSLDPMLCNNFAKYRVGDRTMCRKHAGAYCLDELDPEVS